MLESREWCFGKISLKIYTVRLRNANNNSRATLKTSRGGNIGRFKDRSAKVTQDFHIEN